jgi:hypothetical protein
MDPGGAFLDRTPGASGYSSGLSTSDSAGFFAIGYLLLDFNFAVKTGSFKKLHVLPHITMQDSTYLG